jgi:hypothetical protein
MQGLGESENSLLAETEVVRSHHYFFYNCQGGEMAATPDLGSGARKGVRVRVPPLVIGCSSIGRVLGLGPRSCRFESCHLNLFDFH